MKEHTAILAKPTQLRRSSTRRWDIDLAILALLKSGPRTASRLYRELNPQTKPGWILTARGWKHRLLNITVDNRVLMRHLKYLIRDGLIAVQPQLKVLHHDKGLVGWNVKYYLLREQNLSSTPSPSPLAGVKAVSEIHNPFNGEEGMLRYMRWLRDM